MSNFRHAVRVVHFSALLSVALSAAAATEPCPRDAARCFALVAPDARLACYDALAASPPAVATPTPAAATAEAPAPSAGPAPAPPQAAPADVQAFGITKSELPATPKGPESIKALVARVSEDNLGNAYVQLDNGQTWTTSEHDAQLRPGDPVTIRRASLGSYLMTTPGRRSYRVRRVQ